jgi:hypothetical protein
VWILQELGLARKAYVIIGQRKEPVYYFLAVHNVFQLRLDGLNLDDDDELSIWVEKVKSKFFSTQILYVLQVLLMAYEGGKLKMLDLLQHSARFEASVPQDQIFALFSLTTDQDRSFIDIDYKKPLNRHIEDVVRESFIHYGFQFQRFGRYLNSWAADSPSWIAPESTFYYYHRSSIQVEMFSIVFKDFNIREVLEQFKSGGDAPVIVSKDNFPRPGILAIPCYIVGTVIACKHTWPSDDEIELISDLLERVVRLQKPPNIALDLFTIRNCLRTILFLQKMLSIFCQSGQLSTDLMSLDGLEINNQIWWLPLCHHRQTTQGLIYNCKGRYEQLNEKLFREFTCLINALQTDDFLGLRKLIDANGDDLETWEHLRDTVISSQLYASCVDSCLEKDTSIFKITGKQLRLGPDSLQVGDSVVIFPGMGVPYIIRQVRPGVFSLISQAYVLGIMYGEFLNTVPTPEPTWIELC